MVRASTNSLNFRRKAVCSENTIFNCGGCARRTLFTTRSYSANAFAQYHARGSDTDVLTPGIRRGGAGEDAATFERSGATHIRQQSREAQRSEREYRSFQRTNGSRSAHVSAGGARRSFHLSVRRRDESTDRRTREWN